MQWDAEARETAYRRAKALQRRDPDAAAELLALLESQAPGGSPPTPTTTTTTTTTTAPATTPTTALTPQEAQEAPGVWDPMAAYAACARVYHFSHRDMQGMHYATFFGYLREAVLAEEREKASIDAQMSEHGGGAYGSSGDGREVLDPAADPAVEARLAQYASRPVRWEHARDS